MPKRNGPSSGFKLRPLVSELRLGGLTWGVSRQTSSCTRVRQSNLLIHELFRPFSENFSPQLADNFHRAGLPSLAPRQFGVSCKLHTALRAILSQWRALREKPAGTSHGGVFC